MSNTQAEKDRLNQLSNTIIGAAIDVHRELGPGMLESAYKASLAFELTSRGMSVEREKPVPLVYKSHRLDCGYRVDLIVDNSVVVEVKAIDPPRTRPRCATGFLPEATQVEARTAHQLQCEPAP